MQTRRASIKETGEELSQAEWERFDVAVAELKTETSKDGARDIEPGKDRPGAPATPRR